MKTVKLEVTWDEFFLILGSMAWVDDQFPNSPGEGTRDLRDKLRAQAEGEDDSCSG